VVLVSAGGELHAVSITDGEARPLGIRTDGHGLYLPGFLVYGEQSGVVRAAPFDVESLSVTGASISVLENVLRPNFTDATLLTASHDGTIVYVPGTSERRLVLVDRAGRETALPFKPGPYRSVAVSPDGLRLLVDRRGEPLRILDVETGGDRPAAGVLRGVWSPGGNEILAAAGASGVVRSSVAPGSSPVSVTEDGPFLFPAHWGADGVALFFTLDFRAENRGGLHMMRLDRDAAPVPLIDTEADERWITRSPDGRWIAYTSDLSGTTEVYVREFPGGEPRQVSVIGAEHAVFSRSGEELYFPSGERMYALRTDQLDAPGSLDPELLFEKSYVLLGPSWDVRPQGDFLMVSAGPQWLREILVVQGWVDELQTLFDDAVR
jgi:WD40 repeat protein